MRGEHEIFVPGEPGKLLPLVRDRRADPQGASMRSLLAEADSQGAVIHRRWAPAASAARQGQEF